MEEVKGTKQKIIYESLRLFSDRGYDGVSMREIAAAVGIKGASIYNHFRGKEDIFSAIFEQMTKMYDENVGMTLHLSDSAETAVQTFLGIEKETLWEMAEYIFSFFTQNKFVVMFRKLLVSEQYKSSMAAKRSTPSSVFPAITCPISTPTPSSPPSATPTPPSASGYRSLKRRWRSEESGGSGLRRLKELALQAVQQKVP